MAMRRALVDLAEDCGLAAGRFRAVEQHTGRDDRDVFVEGKLGSGQQAHRRRQVFRRREAARAGPEIPRDELVANLGRTRFHALKTVVAHSKAPLCCRARPSRFLNARRTPPVASAVRHRKRRFAWTAASARARATKRWVPVFKGGGAMTSATAARRRRT